MRIVAVKWHYHADWLAEIRSARLFERRLKSSPAATEVLCNKELLLSAPIAAAAAAGAAAVYQAPAAGRAASEVGSGRLIGASQHLPRVKQLAASSSAV